jgi:hypothetical protein
MQVLKQGKRNKKEQGAGEHDLCNKKFVAKCSYTVFTYNYIFIFALLPM